MSRFYYYRFHCDAHGKGKILALSDTEFRLLTRIWALARESEKPGWVYVVPGVGWDPKDLARTAGCKGSGKPEAMLKRLAQLVCITVHEGGVIEVHDWEDHNPPSPPSKQPEARRHQKAKERCRQGVARRHDGDNGGDTLPGRQTDKEEEEEKDEEAAAAARERDPAGPAAATPAPRRADEPPDDEPQRKPLTVVDETVGLPPTAPRWQRALAFQRAIADGLARTKLFSAAALTPNDWDELEALLAEVGLDAAVAYCLERARSKKPGKPIASLGWFLVVLRDVRPRGEVLRHDDTPEPPRASLADAIARETARCPDWGDLLQRITAPSPDGIVKPDVAERYLAQLSGTRVNGTLTLAAPTAEHAAFVVEQYVDRIVERYAPPFKVRVVGPDAAIAARSGA